MMQCYLSVTGWNLILTPILGIHALFGFPVLNMILGSNKYKLNMNRLHFKDLKEMPLDNGELVLTFMTAVLACRKQEKLNYWVPMGVEG